MKIIIVGGQAGAKIAHEIFSMNYPESEIQFAETYWDDKRAEQIVDDYTKLPEILKGEDVRYFIATGDNFQRGKIYRFLLEKTGQQPLNCIHSNSIISPSAKLGYGNLICPSSVIHTDATVGNCCIINTGSIVEHDCIIRDFAQISPNVTLCGRVQIGEFCFIGASSTVIPNKQVGNMSVVGAGSVVIDYVPQNVLTLGTPAKIKKTTYNEI